MWWDSTSLFLPSFVPLGSSGFAESSRPGQSTTETLRMHPRVFPSTLQRLREKLMLTAHDQFQWPLCVLFHTNWSHRAGAETTHHMNVHSISQLGVAMWVCEALTIPRLSTIYSFTLYLWLYSFLSLSLNVAFTFKRNKVIYILLWFSEIVFIVCSCCF